MAQYLIKFVCGCEKKVGILGPAKYRRDRAAFFSTIKCPECRKEETQNNFAELSEKMALQKLMFKTNNF